MPDGARFDAASFDGGAADVGERDDAARDAGSTDAASALPDPSGPTSCTPTDDLLHAGHASDVAIVYTGSAWGVLWQEEGRESEIDFALFDDFLRLSSGPVRVSSSPGFSREPTIASSGSDMLACWTNGVSVASTKIECRAIARDGTLAPTGWNTRHATTSNSRA